MSERRSRGPFSVIARILWLLFGAYIVVTSLVGAIVGVQAFNGWLAILYGALGATMGLAAILSCFVSGPRRSLFVGWSLVALAAPALPAICPPPPPAGKSVLLISYPPGVFPWETAERKYMEACT